MKPVTMLHLMDDVPGGKGAADEAVQNGHKAGDCLRACVASILEMEAEQVPHFVQYRDADYSHLWWDALVGWCAQIGVHVTYDPEMKCPPGWSLANGTSKRGHKHVCVAYEGRVVWDPHPSRAGLVGEVDEFFGLYPISDFAEEMLAKLPPGSCLLPQTAE